MNSTKYTVIANSFLRYTYLGRRTKKEIVDANFWDNWVTVEDLPNEEGDPDIAMFNLDRQRIHYDNPNGWKKKVIE